MPSPRVACKAAYLSGCPWLFRKARKVWFILRDTGLRRKRGMDSDAVLDHSLHVCPSRAHPYPHLAVSTDVFPSLLFFTVFGTRENRLNEWSATRWQQTYRLIKTPGQINGGVTNICGVFCFLRLRSWHSQTRKVAAKTWKPLRIFTQQSVGCVVAVYELFLLCVA